MSLRLPAILATLAAIVLSLFAIVAHANPLELITSNITATTTVAYMSPGAATTTYAFDSYSNGVSDPNGMDYNSMLVQFTASSTSSVLSWKYEFSQGVSGVDCVATPNACDWYADNTGSIATTSPNLSIGVGQTTQWNFASSSQGGGLVSGSNNRALKAVTVPTPTRYVRAVFTVPAGATNGGVWATFIPQKQQPE